MFMQKGLYSQREQNMGYKGSWAAPDVDPEQEGL